MPETINIEQERAIGIIYRATCSVNGKVYIGQTIGLLSTRKSQHKSDAKRKIYPNVIFGKAIRKYGFENFIFEQIDDNHSNEGLDALEKFWIKFYKSNDRNYGYNLTEGGNGVQKGFKHCDQTKEKIKFSNLYRAKSVRCIETNRIYTSSKDASRQLGLSENRLWPVLNGLTSTCKGMHWEYVDAKHKKPIKILKNPNRKITTSKRKVINLKTGIIYDCASSAAKMNGLKRSQIREQCLQKTPKELRRTEYVWEFMGEKL